MKKLKIFLFGLVVLIIVIAVALYIRQEKVKAIEGMKVTILGGGNVQGTGGMRICY